MTFAIIKLFLGGILKRLIGLATGAFRWIAASPVHMLIALAVILAAVGLYERGQASKWHRTTLAAQTALETQRRAYEAAQDAALAAQNAADLANASGQQNHLAQLEKTNARLEAAHDSDMQRFADSHRLPAQAAGSASCRSSAAGVHPDSGATGAGSTASDTYALTRAEAERTRATEVQNAERGEWIRGLIDMGLAVIGQ